MKKLNLINTVASEVVIYLSKPDIGSNISRKLNTTYAHLVKVLHLLEESKIVKSKKEGRRKIIQLTNKGKEIQENLINIKRLL